MTDKCYGVTGWLFGHKYKPRCDMAQEHGSDLAKNLADALAALPCCHEARSVVLSGDVEMVNQVRLAFADIASQDAYYIGDICVRCGHIVDRPPDLLEETGTDELLDLLRERMEDAEPLVRAQFQQFLLALEEKKADKVEPEHGSLK